jgi:hypothetical protein
LPPGFNQSLKRIFRDTLGSFILKYSNKEIPNGWPLD